MRRLVVGICLFVIAASFSYGQSDRGTITGTISDPTNAVIPGVSVVATNAETGAKYETISTETGNFTLPQLPPGTYQLSAELPGFKKYIRQGITVLVAQTLRLDVGLQVGAATDEVTVNADAPLLRTESSDLSHNVNSERLDELPLLGIGGVLSGSAGIRNPYAMVQLIPGKHLDAEQSGPAEWDTGKHPVVPYRRPGCFKHRHARRSRAIPAWRRRHPGSRNPDQQFRG